MNDLIQRSLAMVQQNQKPSVPWPVDQIYPQPILTYDPTTSTWVPHTSTTSPTTSPSSQTQLAIYTWNIDFMLPHPTSRLSAAIHHLRTLHRPTSPPALILLQECLASDLTHLSQDPWVRATFHLTDLDTSNWQSGYYGTATLIDRRLSVRGCGRVHFEQTRMERDVLFVDIQLDVVGGGKEEVVRVGNTHLESLALEPAFRPGQMEVAAGWMKRDGVRGAILAGDMNAVQEFDRGLHAVNGLKDAFLEMGGREEGSEGHTWGQQASTELRERFGTCRMDKVLFCGGLKLVSYETLGAGVEVEDEKERREIVELGFEKPWVTDHLGVRAIFDV